MNYLITPPNTHYDNGLGITADSFLSAAKILKDNDETNNEILPLCYLQRHAIELYLKSFIVILHKRYNVSYGSEYSTEKPAIYLNNKWVSLSEIHNILNLYEHFLTVYTTVLDKLPTTTDWSLPDDIKKQINLISGSDPKSTYFRYPEASNTAHDSKKHNIKKETLESMLKKYKQTNEPIKCTLMFDDNDELVDSYNIKATPMPNILKALNELTDFCYCMHAAIRFEVTNGT
jgi:hypothetical protein